MTSNWVERFSTYFDREIAQKAAKSLSNGAEIEIQIDGETFTFTKADGKNQVSPGPAKDPQVVFTMTPKAAEAILTDTTEEIGAIGVNILKLIVSKESDRRVQVKLKAGFLTLFSKGYFGVLTAGGSEFAGYLASRGLNGMDAIKAALKKLKS